MKTIKTSLKVIAPIVAVAALSLSLASCLKKDYTCTCYFSNGTKQEIWLGKMSNNAAQKKCNDQQLSLTKNATGTGLVSSCKVLY